MTKIRSFIVTAIICLCAFTSSAQFSSQQAKDLVLNQVLSGELDQVDVFMLNEARSGQEQINLENNESVDLTYSNNWVFFVDDHPFANWAHPCRYIFVSTSDGEYQVVDNNFFPVNWESDYSTISEMPRPTRPELPENSGAKIEGLETNSNVYAVVLNGFDQYRYWNDISAIYCTLLDVYGYTKENIYVHYDQGNSIYGNDLDNDGQEDDIDYDAYKSSIQHTFEEMAGETNTSPEIPELGPEDQLFIFVDDHGYMMEGQSYINLPGDDLADYEMAEYLEDINSAQIMAIFEPCYMGGFETELSDYVNYNVSCKNRSIQTASDDESSYAEVWITGGNYDEFVYYWTAAARGRYPLVNEPWTPSNYETGTFPFGDYFNNHPGDYNPDLNGDDFVQMEEAFSYANDLDTWSPDGYYNPYYSGYEENPQEFTDISFNEDLLMLTGIAGHVENSQTIDSRNYLIGGELTIDPNVALTFEGNSKFFLNSDSAGLQVKPEGTLTLKSELQFSENSFFHIEPGGESVIDGGNLTNLDTEPWQGIQVWGQADSSQYSYNAPCPQGKLEIINGGTIENAEIGVNLWHPDHWNSMGGIVQAEDAVFRNNAKAVHASHYHNYFPTTPEREADNLSRFTNCTFEITDDYPGTTTFYKHVDLADVRGIDFEGCDFSVDDQVNGVSTWNSGIAAYDAVFDVEAA